MVVSTNMTGQIMRGLGQPYVHAFRPALLRRCPYQRLSRRQPSTHGLRQYPAVVLAALGSDP